MFTIRQGLGVLEDVEGTMVFPGKAIDFSSPATYRFTPLTSNKYGIEKVQYSFEAFRSGTTVYRGSDLDQSGLGDAKFIRLSLDIPFPIGGKDHRSAWVSQAGAIVFSDSSVPPEARAELETYHAFARWGPSVVPLYEPSRYPASARITSETFGDHTTITWENLITRHTSQSNTFQARLYRNGEVVLSYKSLNVDHGTVGINSGIVDGHVQISSVPGVSIPTAPDWMNVLRASISTVADQFLEVSFECQAKVPDHLQLPEKSWLTYGFKLNNTSVVGVMIQRPETNLGIKGTFVFGDSRLRSYLIGVQESISVDGSRVSFLVPLEALSPFMTGHDRWSLEGSLSPPLAGPVAATWALTESALFGVSTDTSAYFPSEIGDVLERSAYLHQFTTDSVNEYRINESIAAYVGSQWIDNVYWFPHRATNTLGHTILAHIYRRRSSVTGIGSSPFGEGDPCNCHFGAQFVPLLELARLGRSAYYPLSHEIGHQESFYLLPPGEPAVPEEQWYARDSCGDFKGHMSYGISNESMFPDPESKLPSRSIMGGSVRDLSGKETNASLYGFSPLEMYLMGMAYPHEVPPLRIYDPLGNLTHSVPISEIIAANGPRTPVYEGKPRLFWIPIVIVLPKGQTVDSQELAKYRELIQGWQSHFEMETRGRGWMDTSIPALPAPRLTIERETEFTQGQVGAQFKILVNNAGLADFEPAASLRLQISIGNGATLTSVSGDGWSCSGSTCTRSDGVAAGSGHSPVTVTARMADTAPEWIQIHSECWIGTSYLVADDSVYVRRQSSVPSRADGI